MNFPRHWRSWEKTFHTISNLCTCCFPSCSLAKMFRKRCWSEWPVLSNCVGTMYKKGLFSNKPCYMPSKNISYCQFSCLKYNNDSIRKQAPHKHLEATDAWEILLSVKVDTCTYLEYLTSRRIEPFYSPLQAIDTDQLGVLRHLPYLHFSLNCYIKTRMFKLRCQ